MKGSRSTCTRCVGGPGRLSPPPPLRCRSRGGRGGRAGGLGPAWDLEQGRGDLWLVSKAGLIRMWIWQVYMAGLYGKFIRQLFMAGLFGGSSGLIYSIDLKARKHTVEKKRNRKE